MRNLELHAVDIVSVSTKSRGAQICRQSDAYEPEEKPYDPQFILKTKIPGTRVIQLDERLAPAGGNTRYQSTIVSDISEVYLYSKGVIGASDLRFHWQWADGHSPGFLLSKLHRLTRRH